MRRITSAVRSEQPDEAIAVVRQSLTRIRDLHDKFAFVYALVPLAAAEPSPVRSGMVRDCRFPGNLAAVRRKSVLISGREPNINL